MDQRGVDPAIFRTKKIMLLILLSKRSNITPGYLPCSMSESTPIYASAFSP